MARGAAPVHIDREARHVTLDRVPAWVCYQCDEAYFEEGEVKKIQEVIQSVEKKAAEIVSIPPYAINR